MLKLKNEQFLVNNITFTILSLYVLYVNLSLFFFFIINLFTVK